MGPAHRHWPPRFQRSELRATDVLGSGPGKLQLVITLEGGGKLITEDGHSRSSYHPYPPLILPSQFSVLLSMLWSFCWLPSGTGG